MSERPQRLEEASRRLKQLLGPGGYLESPADVAPFLSDFRQLYRGATPLVALPASTTEVSAILGACHELRVGVVPHGGNTSYCGGATPSAAGDQIVVAMRRMKRIRELDAANYSITVEAGCLLADVQSAAEGADRLFPLSMGSEGSCQVGGNLSTNAGGLAALRYGVARDLVLGLEVVLADGRVIDDLKSLRKDNTGYDLRHLFIGAEGTLGIITAASLKLFPLPRTVETAIVAVPDMEAAVRLLGMLRDATGDCVTSFEFMPRIAVELAARHVGSVSDPLDRPYPAYVLCEVSTSRVDPALRALLEECLAAAIERGQALDAAMAESLAQRQAFWLLRESIPEGQRREGASLKHDVSVPVADLPRFLRDATEAVRKVVPTGRLVAYGHVGDGNLHFNVSEPLGGGDREAFLGAVGRLQTAVFEVVDRYRGSISAEHGIGQLKRAELGRYESAAEIAVMRAIKQALDPRGIMNPGKVLPDE